MENKREGEQKGHKSIYELRGAGVGSKSSESRESKFSKPEANFNHTLILVNRKSLLNL